MKAFANHKLNVTRNIRVVFHRIENIVGKEENAGYQHFLLFPQCFQKAFSFSGSTLCGKGVPFKTQSSDTEFFEYHISPNKSSLLNRSPPPPPPHPLEKPFKS